MPGSSHGGLSAADAGNGGRAGLLQIPPGAEPGALVGPARGEDPAGAAGRGGCQPRVCAGRAGGRDRGAAQGQEDQGEGSAPRAVRSTQGEVVKCWGLKWICLTLLVPLPWSPRPWALPFLTLLAPPAQADEKAGRRHKTTVDCKAVGQVSRWLASAAFTVVGCRRRRVCQRRPGPRLPGAGGHAGVAPAAGRPAVRLPGSARPRPARAQAKEGRAPAQPEGTAGRPGPAVAGRRGGVVRRCPQAGAAALGAGRRSCGASTSRLPHNAYYGKYVMKFGKNTVNLLHLACKCRCHDSCRQLASFWFSACTLNLLQVAIIPD